MIENKRIAFLCHPYHRGGVTRWMADAAIAFAGQGREVYFITVEPSAVFLSGKGRETLLQLLQKRNIPLNICSVKVGREFEFGTQEYRTLIYQQLLLNLPQGTPVILSDDATVWQAAALLHDTYPIVGILHADENHYYGLAEKYFRRLSLLVCVSERVKKTAMQRVPDMTPKAVYTIPCGINLPAADFRGRKNDVLQLVYVGRVSEYQKRVSDLVKVCVLLHQRNILFHLNVIGDGGEKELLENKFKETGLKPFVTFYGWLPQKEVHHWLTASDILLLTSDFEGTPIAMMEALAAGCGLAGTRVSGIEDYEFYPMAENCLALFDVGDIEDAVSKIEKIAAIPVGIRQQSARQLAEAEFSMDVCLKKYNKALETIKTNKKEKLATVRIPFQVMLGSRIIAWARYMKVSIANRKKA